MGAWYQISLSDYLQKENLQSPQEVWFYGGFEFQFSCVHDLVWVFNNFTPQTNFAQRGNLKCKKSLLLGLNAKSKIDHNPSLLLSDIAFVWIILLRSQKSRQRARRSFFGHFFLCGCCDARYSVYISVWGGGLRATCTVHANCARINQNKKK